MRRVLGLALLIAGILLAGMTAVLGRARHSLPRTPVGIVFSGDQIGVPYGLHRRLSMVNWRTGEVTPLNDFRAINQTVGWAADAMHLLTFTNEAGALPYFYRLNIYRPRRLPLFTGGNAQIWLLSPDGRTIAATISQGYTCALWMIPTNGDPAHEVLPSVNCGLPPEAIRWSENGEWFIFPREETANGSPFLFNLWRIRWDGGGLSQLTDFPILRQFPKVYGFSPTGDYLIFNAAVDDLQGNLYRLDWDSEGRVTQLTQNTGVEEFQAWSRDGAWLIYTTAPPGDWELNLFRMGPHGENKRQISVTNGLDTLLTESPQGPWLYFVTTFGGDSSMLWRTTLEGTPQEAIPFSYGFPEFEGWSPDGKLLLTAFKFDGTSDLYALDERDLSATLLVKRLASEKPVIFSPEGQWLVVSKYDDVYASNTLYRMRPNGDSLQPITPPPQADFITERFEAWIHPVDLPWRVGRSFWRGLGLSGIGLVILCWPWQKKEKAR